MSLTLFVAVALLVPVRADDAEPVDDAVIARLVEQLGADDFSVRQAASHELYGIGQPALPRLRLARTATDVEVRRRADRLVPRIVEQVCRSDSTGLVLVLLAPGEFSMGSPEKESGRKDDENLHSVRLTRPFLVGVHEVTQAEYRAVIETNPSWFRPDGAGGDKLQVDETGRFPVDTVTWFDAIAFCNALSRRDGFDSYYLLADAKRADGAIIEAKVVEVGGTGYRLPTEAEWEYACRAGTTADFAIDAKKPRGNFKTMQSSSYGSSRVVSLGRTAAVGSYTANPWGLHDMHGNVSEWCSDWYETPYPTADVARNPTGPARGRHRVLRSGSWLVPSASCRSAARFWSDPAESPNFAGFRVVRDAPQDLIENWPPFEQSRKPR